MMVDWLGDARVAAWIEGAVAAALRNGEGLTADLGGSRSTEDAGAAVLRELERAAD